MQPTTTTHRPPAATAALPPAPLGYYYRGQARHVAARAPGAPATNVAVTPRWHGSGPAHWHCGPVRTRHVAPVATATNLATVRKRGMYGY